MNSHYSIGIIGNGILGNAIFEYYKNRKDCYQIIIYDKYTASYQYKQSFGKLTLESRSAIDMINNTCDYIFVCVPTPTTTSDASFGYDMTQMNRTMELISDNKNIIIKSTVHPGDTNNYQGIWNKKRIVFNPEFLTEATAIDDFANPDKQIIGYTDRSYSLAVQLKKILPPSKNTRLVPAKEAEILKLMINSYYAIKVIFANDIYDAVSQDDSSLDFFRIMEMFSMDKRITNSHFDPLFGGYRGFGGKCLPKDIKAMSRYLKSHNRHHLLKTVIAINDSLNRTEAMTYDRKNLYRDE